MSIEKQSRYVIREPEPLIVDEDQPFTYDEWFHFFKTKGLYPEFRSDNNFVASMARFQAETCEELLRSGLLIIRGKDQEETQAS